MMPNAPDSFWSHVPGWGWPIVIAGLLCFFGYHILRVSESVARHFGPLGRHIHERASAPRRTLRRVEHIEDILLQTSDKLECATAYLVVDAEYHHSADVLIAENYPKLFQLLPKRVSFTEFSRLWQTGWRP